jgi:hypothetical protein
MTVPRLRLFVFVAVAVALVIALPVAGWAGHTFSDVPESDWAHDDIAWLYDQGLTNGCGDGTTYCPDDAVTRREIAAFVHRLAGSRAVDAGTLEGYSAVELLHPQGAAIHTISGAAFHPTTTDSPFKYALTGSNYVIATEPDTQLCVVAPVSLPDA